MSPGLPGLAAISFRVLFRVRVIFGLTASGPHPISLGIPIDRDPDGQSQDKRAVAIALRVISGPYVSS